MAWRGLWLGSLLFSAGFAACVTNHEALEKKPGGRGGNGSGGTFAAGGMQSQRGGSGGAAENGGGHADDEPPGDSVLTIVNGIVDAPRVALCLAKFGSDGTVTPFGSPLTEEPLEYGQSSVLREVNDIDVDTDGLQLFAIAGELERIAGLDCDEAISRARSVESLNDAAGSDATGESGQGGAGGDSSGLPSSSGGSAGEGGSAGASPGPRPVRAPLRVRGLPAISAGTLNAGRSLVFVANGCMGGTAYGGKSAEEYCGAGYTPREPTVSAVLVSLSRQVSTDHVALQVVHASLANSQVDLRARPPFPSKSMGVAIASVQAGQVGPRPASIQNALFDLGSARKYQVSIESEGNVLYEQGWSTVLSQGSLEELENGKGYALVFNGPRADLTAVPDTWNAPSLTAVAVDPE